MMLRLIYWFTGILSFLTLSLGLLFAWLVFTTAGGYWLTQQVPGLTVQGFKGQLASQWQAKQVQWQNNQLSLIFDEVSFNWLAGCLLDFKLCINDLEVAALTITTNNKASPKTPSPILDWSEGRLPRLELPRLDLQKTAHLNGLTIDQLNLGLLTLNGQEQLSELQLTASWQATLINLEKLELASPWLVASLEAEKLTATRVELKGWLLAEDNWPLEVNLTSKLSLASEPNNLPLALAVSGDFEKLQLKSHLAFPLVLPSTLPKANKKSAISLNGWVNLLAPSVPLDLTLAWQNLDPHQIVAQLNNWPNNLELQKGRLSLQGDLQTGWQLVVDTEQKLEQLAVKLNLSSNISWDRLRIEKLRLNLGDGSWLAMQLDATQNAAKKINLSGQVMGQLVTQLADPTQFDTAFSGYLATKTLNSDTLDYQLSLPKFNLITGQEKLALALNLNPQNWQSDLALQVSDFEALINALLTVVANNLPELLSANQVTELVNEYPLEGDLKLSSNLTIPALPINKKMVTAEVLKLLSQGEYQLNLASEHLNYSAYQLENTDLKLTYVGLKNPQDPEISLALVSQQLKIQGNKASKQEALLIQAIKMNLEGVLSEHQLTAGIRLDKQPLEMGIQGGVVFTDLTKVQWRYQLTTLASELIQPWLPEDLRWTDQLDGELQGEWQNQQLKLGLELTSGPGELAIRLEDTLNKTFSWVPLTYHLLNLGLTLEDETLKASFTLDGEQLGYLNTEVNLALYPDPSSQQRSLEGNYQLNGFQLQLFSPFIEINQIAGQLAGQGEIRGHLLAPELWGNLQLKEVALADTLWPISLERLNGQLLLQGELVKLEADFTTGEGGAGKLDGELRWQPELTAQVHLKGEDFQVRVEPWASLKVTPDLTLTYQEKGYLLAGKVKIPSGLISVQQLPKQAIKVSEDAQVVGREVIASGNSKLDLNIELLLGNVSQPNRPPLRLEALGLNAELQGRLRVTRDLQTRGELLLVKGVYQSWGQDLKLRKARLSFAGPYRLPFLDIEAVREVQDVVVGIHMTGRVDHPEAEIFSEPVMANEQALSWLILGRPLRTESDENALNAAAISYGLKQASGVTQRLGETLGLKDFELIAEGGGSETSVVASGYINDRLSVRYGVGVYDEVSRFVVRYELSRKVYIEAASSLASSLDIFWRLNF